jgi:hypothetical protein
MGKETHTFETSSSIQIQFLEVCNQHNQIKLDDFNEMYIQMSSHNSRYSRQSFRVISHSTMV